MFELGHNYVVFTDVDINNTNSSDVNISYTNVINGLQLVRKKSPVEVGDDVNIPAPAYDVAGEKNLRSDDPQGYGPDIGNGEIGYMEPPEFMAYDINVSDANKGMYEIGLDVNTANFTCPRVRIYLDDKVLGDVNRTIQSPAIGKTTTRSANLTAGIHTVKWLLPYSVNYGFNLVDVNFVRTDNIIMNNCADVIFYGLTLPADYTKNCIVGLDDLALALDNWLTCNNPDNSLCF